MFARSTTFKGKPAAVDAGIAVVREQVMPAVLQMDGCVGISMLVDRESGGCITTTAWSSEQAMRASEHSVAPLRDRVQQLFGDRPEVRAWEIAVLHRLHPVGEGAWSRVTWTRADPGTVDQQLHIFRIGTLPQLEDLPGFCSASLLIDRRTGEAALAATYESRDALSESRDAAMELRVDATTRMGARIVDVAEFEVALAHLRVPETV
jgi:quinol monooxygenase YgiN